MRYFVREIQYDHTSCVCNTQYSCTYVCMYAEVHCKKLPLDKGVNWDKIETYNMITYSIPICMCAILMYVCMYVCRGSL